MLGAVVVVCINGTLKWLDRLCAEKKGWIFDSKKSGSGTVSGGVGAAMTRDYAAAYATAPPFDSTPP